MTNPVVGFIGLGLMGSGFTRRLIATGHRVIGYDIDPAKIEAAAQFGVERAASPAELADAADVILACVTSTAAVVEVVEAHRVCSEHRTCAARSSSTIRQRRSRRRAGSPTSLLSAPG